MNQKPGSPGFSLIAADRFTYFLIGF